MRQLGRFVRLAGSLSVGALLAAPALAVEEPETDEDITVTIERAVDEAADAAQQAAEQIFVEVQRAAGEEAAELAKKAEAVAKDAADQAADAAKQLVQQAGNRNMVLTLSSDYRLSLQVSPVSAALDSQLKLDGKGILVTSVSKGGPADKAGIQVNDILLSVNDLPITKTNDLGKVVRESKGQELKVTLLRAGESQSVTVVPRVDSGDMTLDFNFPTEDIEVEIHKLESKIREKLKDAGVDVRMQLMRPAHMMPPGAKFVIATKMPDDLSITIDKEGSKPAKIKVRKGDESWSITEDKLNELPDEVRPHVERMLGRIPTPFAINWQGKPVTVPLPPRAVRDIVVVEEARDEVRKRAKEARQKVEQVVREKVRPALENQLEHISRDMERMSKQMEQLRGELQKLSEAVEVDEDETEKAEPSEKVEEEEEVNKQ